MHYEKRNVMKSVTDNWWLWLMGALGVLSWLIGVIPWHL
jgi:hypothetical protein